MQETLQKLIPLEAVMVTTRVRFYPTALLILLVLRAAPALGQDDPSNVPSAPSAELALLESFFGSYEHSDQQWGGMGPFDGTLDVGAAIKGWYVEFVINTRFGPIDRQLRMLTTWDPALGRYRVWRFETLPQGPPGTVEAEAYFDGQEFVMEWKSIGPNGEPGTFRNRVRMEGPDRLLILSEVTPDGGEPFVLGTWDNRRVSGMER